MSCSMDTIVFSYCLFIFHFVLQITSVLRVRIKYIYIYIYILYIYIYKAESIISRCAWAYKSRHRKLLTQSYFDKKKIRFDLNRRQVLWIQKWTHYSIIPIVVYFFSKKYITKSPKGICGVVFESICTVYKGYRLGTYNVETLYTV